VRRSNAILGGSAAAAALICDRQARSESYYCLHNCSNRHMAFSDAATVKHNIMSFYLYHGMHGYTVVFI
jgi:hypothetical protein